MLQRRTSLKPGKPLPRPAGLPPRKAPLSRSRKLPAVSPKGSSSRAAQRKAYDAAPDAGQDWCSVCGEAAAVHHSHLLSQGNHQKHRNNPLNWLISCWPCHCLFEHKKREFAARRPEAWALIQDRILQVGGPQALAFFQLKNPF